MPQNEIRKQSIRRTFKRLNHRVNMLSKEHFVAVVSIVHGKFEVAGSPVITEILSKPEVKDSIQVSVNAAIAKKYLKFPGAIKKKQEKCQSDSSKSTEEVAENLESVTENMTDEND